MKSVRNVKLETDNTEDSYKKWNERFDHIFHKKAILYGYWETYVQKEE